jgi:hypothetical protein
MVNWWLPEWSLGVQSPSARAGSHEIAALANLRLPLMVTTSPGERGQGRRRA